MRFMVMIKGSERSGPPPQALMEAIAKLAEEETRAGTMIETGGLLPSFMGARVRLTKGQLTVVDGPFTEAKEVVGGYAIQELSSREEAIEKTVRFMELHREHWPEWNGEAEVRQIFDGTPG